MDNAANTTDIIQRYVLFISWFSPKPAETNIIWLIYTIFESV